MTEAERENIKQSIVIHDDYIEGYLKVEAEANKIINELLPQREAMDMRIKQARDSLNLALKGRFACTIRIHNLETHLKEDSDVTG